MKTFLNINLFLAILISLFLASFNVYAETDDAPIFVSPPGLNEQFAPTPSDSASNASTTQPPQPPSPALTGDRETVIKENLIHTGPEGGLAVDKIPPVYSTDRAASN